MATRLEISFEFRNKRFTSALAGLTALGVRLDRAVDRTGPVLSKELRGFLDTVALALQRRHGVPWPAGTTAQTLSKRSGAGIQSIQNSVRIVGENISNIQGEIGGRMQLRIHETGGIIRARNVKYLTIPLPAALDDRGVPLRASAREWDKTFVARTKRGNLLIFRRTGRTITPLYLLKKQVKIPARLGMRKTLDAGLPLFVDRAMDAMLKELIDGIETA